MALSRPPDGTAPKMRYRNLWQAVTVELTDIGGLQEGALTLSVPLITIAGSVGRPVTSDECPDHLAGTDRSRPSWHWRQRL